MTSTGDRAATDPATLLTEFATALRDTLGIPYAALGGTHERQRAILLEKRADAAYEAAAAIAEFEEYPELIRVRIDALRTRIAQLPVMYDRYIATARDLPDDCQVCGPGCCNPFLGIHGAAPGPHSGEMAVTR
jgi:hypothetical protein